MLTAQATGLTVEKQNSNGWKVYHESSGLPAGGPYLRLKRHALEMRDDLYATGCDFTQPVSAFRDSAVRCLVYPVLDKWHGRVAHDYDTVTGEHYKP